MKNVFNIEQQLKYLKDGRANPTYQTKQVVLITLMGFLLRLSSLSEINRYIKSGEFDNLFLPGTKLPKVDSIRNTMKQIDIEGLRRINKYIVRKAIRNKTFQYGTFEKYIIAAIDGTQILDSKKKKCESCLTMNKRGVAHYTHNAAVMSTIGNTPNIALDFEMYRAKKNEEERDEGEFTAAIRLLNRVVEEYAGLIDIVYDALACNSVFIKECQKLGIDAIVRVKKTTNLSLKEVKRATNNTDAVVKYNQNGYDIEVYESTFCMNDMDEPFRYIKYAKEKQDGDKTERTQVLIITTCMDMKLEMLYRIIRARWDIENKTFNNLKNNASLTHCFIHGGNAIEAILYLLFSASNIFQLFKLRRLRNHIIIQKELVRLLIKGLYTIKRSREIIFSSA